MKIENFWDIEAWKESRELTKKIYIICKNFNRDFELTRQIQSSAISIMANIAEGFERKTDKEFVHFLTIARGSNAELQSHLFIASDLGYVSEIGFNELFERSKKIEKIINSFISYLKKCG